MRFTVICCTVLKIQIQIQIQIQMVGLELVWCCDRVMFWGLEGSIVYCVV
jgi:hypothetical protein